MKLDNFAQQIQDMQQRLAQIQWRIGELPSIQQQNELMATAFEELGKGLEELQITSHEHIQERKHAEEALRLSEKRFRLAVDNFPDGTFVIYDAQRRLQFVNAHGIRLGGLPELAVLGHTDEEIHPPEITDTYLPFLQEAVETRTSQTAECTITLPTVGKITFVVTYVPLLDERGEIYQILGITHHITERKQAEDALRESEAQFRTLVANIPGVVYRCAHSQEWQGMFLSDAIEDLFGYPASDFTRGGTRTFSSIIYPEDVKRVEQIVEAALAERQPFALEYRIVHSDGSLRWVSEKGQGIFGEQGELLWLDGVIFDITKRKQAESALKANHEFLQTVLDTNPNLIWVKDREDRVVLANQALADFFGTTVEDLLGKINYDLFNPADAELCIAQDQEVINTLRQKFIPEEAFPSVTGEVRWFQTIKTPLFSKDGQVCQVLGVSTDITQRKLAEEAQRQTQARLQRLVEANLIGVIFADFSGNITEANDTFLEMVGYTREELHVGKVRWVDMTPPEYAEDDAQAREQIRLTGVCTPHEKEYIRKDGTRVPILTGSALLDGSDQDCVSFVLDLTWRKQAERQIEESLREKEVLLQEIHHRVKNNLQVVSSLLDLQCLQIKEPTMLEMFRESQNRVKSMALVHENLYQSKNFARVNFTDYIETLIKNLFQAYGVSANHITLEKAIDEVSLSIDTAIPCGLIINELVSNALKYAFPNKNKGTIYISLHSEEGGYYTLTIKDNGRGLPFNWEIKTVESLGLQLVNILANQLEGTLQVDCSLGTEFSLRFKERS